MMETKSHNPSFTVSLRGYDREEVDEYLDSLAEALGQVENAEEHNRRLQSHINRLNARIKDLEDRISSESPRTGIVIGERIGILLREAEDTASETVTRAEAKAAEIISEAETKAEQAEETVRSATARAEAEGRRIESAARAEAADIVAEADNRAAARTRQIEQWAEQVISHTRAEEARMLSDKQEKKKIAAADLKALADQRVAAATMLGDLREALGMALGLVTPEAGTHDNADLSVVADEQLAQAAEVTDTEALDPGPVSHIDLTNSEGSDIDGDNVATELPFKPADEGFEAKLEAWVSSGNGDTDQRG